MAWVTHVFDLSCLLETFPIIVHCTSLDAIYTASLGDRLNQPPHLTLSLTDTRPHTSFSSRDPPSNHTPSVILLPLSPPPNSGPEHVAVQQGLRCLCEQIRYIDAMAILFHFRISSSLRSVSIPVAPQPALRPSSNPHRY
ncbi:hypothetical protein NW754_011528 [Fusarium falciforme]|uniref:Uncharacterized protein n=1 Tax=Fusarium falciforme TaxID=195108 RepID=A0A9W8R529_9HYPO|nr:hypothetical protein NW754_011528 [Fusarium falciforme]KAJ4188058.1 hypothetical protein NW755_006852 [Fusarium falciforme]KAJ4251724.1 hypothetical protein NW757_006559 [Fusarium falciforme]